MLSNILFGLTSLFYLGLAIFNFPKPSLTGENAMGYGLGLAFFGLGLAVSSLLLTLNIGWKGGFDWVSPHSGTRNLLIGIGWLSFVAATFFCAYLRWEWHGEFPLFIRWFALSHVEIWLPFLMLVTCFMSLNITPEAGSRTFLLPLKIGFALSLFISLGLLFGWLRESFRVQAALVETRIAENDALQVNHLKFIGEQKPEDPIVNILALTGRFHDKIVRDSAINKVKSHPDWEAELLRLLDNEYYFSEAYTFIDGNTVDHPELFVEPLNRSIRHMATEIKGLIVDSNNLQDWHFEHFGIERLLRAIDEQFSNQGMDFRPAIRALQQALKTPPPERFKNVRFTVIPTVDAWLKAHP